MKSFLAAICLLFAPPLANASLSPTDFAYGLPLSLKAGGAVYHLDIPMDVYNTVTTGDLEDIRIFNRDQTMVPHILRLPETRSVVSENKVPLPIVPLYLTETDMKKNGLSVSIEKLENGTFIYIGDQDTAPVKNRKLSGYIIDAGDYSEPIDAMDVTMPEGTKDFVTDISLEFSNDLTHWSTLVGHATLVRKAYQGHEIRKDRIELPGRLMFRTSSRPPAGVAPPPIGYNPQTTGPPTRTLPARYLRLSWPADREGVEIKEILAVQQNGAPEEERSWVTLPAVPISAKDSEEALSREIATYEYDSAARLPVDRVQISFPEKNTLVEATLYSRPDPESNWRFRQRDTFYHLSFDNTTLVHDTILPGLTSDRYWRLELEGAASGFTETAPSIKLGWRPHELLFVAQGEGPFMMAYGSARLGEEESNKIDGGIITQLIDGNEKTLLKKAQASSKIELGGSALLVPEPPPMPWRDWLLWGVLIAGVGVIAKMALNLGKSLNKS